MLVILRFPALKNSLPWAELAIGLAVLLSASIAILLTRVAGGSALFWPASALAAALLLRLDKVRWITASLAVLASLVLAHALVAHRPWVVAIVFASLDVLEITLMVVAFRKVWPFAFPTISVNQAARMTAVLGIAIPGATAFLGGLFLHLSSDAAWLSGSLQWWSAHAVGACLLAPPIILYSTRGVERLMRHEFLVQNALTLLVCLAGSYLAFQYVRFPFVTIGLLLLIAAFRLGGFGASLLSLTIGLLIATLWALGIRPLSLDPALTTQGTLIGLPVIALLATVLPPIAVGLGIDARRAVAKALQISERRFRECMEYSPIGMLIAELDGTWRYTNLALQRMLDYTAEEFRAMPPGGPSKTEDWRNSGSRLAKLISGELHYYDVARQFRHRDGHWIWTHVAVSLLRDDDGKPLHLIAQIESLEARQRAEETLAAERERLRITLALITDAVITTDADTRITYVNRAGEVLLGTDMASVTHRKVGEVMHLVDPGNSKTAANLVGQAAHHGKVYKRESACLLHRADGSICYVTDVVSPVISEAGVFTGLVIVLKDATADIERNLDLQRQAMHDPLTGLSNRAHFDVQLRSVFHRAKTTERPAAVIAIDLDKFKAVNDSAGHAAGDAVLREVANACLRTVRTSDTVARIGGDEFVIILDNCAEERATRIAQQILQALNPLAIEWEKTTHLVHASLGLAMTTAMPDEKAWIGAADQACYQAKHQGRGRLQIAGGPAPSLKPQST